MNVISKPRLLKLITTHPQAASVLLAWHKIARAADWSSLMQVRRNFPSADLVGMVLIFDILNNDLRLLTVVFWRSKRIYVKALLTHKQYDQKEWVKKWAH